MTQNDHNSLISKQLLIVSGTITNGRSLRICSALLLNPKNILHKVLDPVTPDDAVYVTLNAAKRLSDWRISDENTGHQQSCASEGIEPVVCTPEFQIMTDRELLTTVSKAWGAISCATAGTGKKSNPL